MSPPEYLRPTINCLQGEGQSASTWETSWKKKTEQNRTSLLLFSVCMSINKYVNIITTPAIVFFANHLNILEKKKISLGLYTRFYNITSVATKTWNLFLASNSNIRSIQKVPLDKNKISSHWARYIKIHRHNYTFPKWMGRSWLCPC